MLFVLDLKGVVISNVKDKKATKGAFLQNFNLQTFINQIHMRISGITIPDNKRLEIGLTSVYGVGRPRALEILSELKIDPGKKPTDLKTEEENSIREKVESFTVEGELRRMVSGNVKRLKDVLAYRGVRHSRNLPTRGQRTKTNTRTVRGNKRKTMSSGRRSVDKK